jgi:hypothetical protein
LSLKMKQGGKKLDRSVLYFDQKEGEGSFWHQPHQRLPSPLRRHALALHWHRCQQELQSLKEFYVDREL